jgi:hypothetical protein
MMNLKRILLILLFLPLIASRLLAEGGSDPMRTWTSNDGRKIEASLVRLSGKKEVVLKLKDGKEYTVAKDRLSAADNAWIAEAVKKDTSIAARTIVDGIMKGMAEKMAPPQNYRFEVTWSKTQVSVAPKDVAEGYEGKVITWKPVFKITNLSGKDLIGLQLLYQMQIKLDRDKSQDDYAFPMGVKMLPLMKANQTLEVEGKPFETLSAKLKAGYVTKDRSRASKSDDVQGVVVKIGHITDLVYEYKSGTAIQDKLGEKMKEMGVPGVKKP